MAVVRGTSRAMMASSSSVSNDRGDRPAPSKPPRSSSITDWKSLLERAESLTKLAMR